MNFPDNSRQEDLPNWTTTIEEVSNGVFKVSLTDISGRKVEIIDSAQDTLLKAVSKAFEIQKLNINFWNKFLYDLGLLLLRGSDITFKEYNEAGFGSWFIEVSREKRIFFNGRDCYLDIQSLSNSKWIRLESIHNSDLSYLTFVRIIGAVKD